jgi:sulfite reductase alpha subunit-like flavoprotein
LFSFPSHPNVPLLLICAGTGIAPMRSIVQSKKYINIHLFYGFRDQSMDFLYRNEWSDVKIYTCTSRQQPKQYVQDKLYEQKSLLWKLLSSENAYVYVAGNKDLPTGIKNTIIKIANENEVNGESFLLSLVRSKRLQIECW